MTTYRMKPFLSDEEHKEVMAVFAEVGSAPGTIAHYVFADGRGGVVITETDSAAEGYRTILNFRPWVQYETTIVLTIDDAVPIIMDALS